MCVWKKDRREVRWPGEMYIRSILDDDLWACERYVKALSLGWRRRKQSFKWKGATASMNSLHPGSSGGMEEVGGGVRSTGGFSTKLKSPHRIRSSLGGSVERNCFKLWEKKIFLSVGDDGA